MFWSPAVATLSVCAPAGPVSRSAASPAAKRCLCMISSLDRLGGEQVQGCQRQAQADRAIQLVVLIVRHGKMTVGDRHHIPVMSARIRSLRDGPGQNDGPVDPRIRIVERSDVVAEEGRDGAE